MMKYPNALVSVLFVTLISVGHGQTPVFSSDFSGSAPWNFDSTLDPNSQLGGTGQLVYTGAASNATAYVQEDIDISTVTSAETGTIVITGTIDLNSFNTGASDFASRRFLSLGTVDGNKSPFGSGEGNVFELGVAGFNNPGELRLQHELAVRFQSGGNANTDAISPASGSESIWDFESTIDIVSSNGTDWTIEATTSFDNGVVTESTSSTFSNSDGGFDGIQDINKLRVGFEGSIDAGDSVAVDNIVVTYVPEPSFAALGMGLLAVAGIMMLRRRQ